MNKRTEIDSDRDPEQLERDIDRTRASLGRTVDELEHRLSPGELLDQALGMAKEHGGEFATNLGRSARNNPVPMLLTGIGLAWMMASSNEPRASTGDGATLGGGARESMQRARSAGAAMSDSARHAGQKVSESVGSAGDRVRIGADRARSSFDHLMEEQPLIVGAIGIALGAALGAALPRTEGEDRLMGGQSDSLTAKAKEKATEAYDEARGRAGEAATTLEEAQRERSGDSQWEAPRGTEH